MDRCLLLVGLVPDHRSRRLDRRRATLSERRRTDAQASGAGVRIETWAALIWELPDETRCWIMRHRGALAVHVSRGRDNLRLEVFESEAAARSQAELWRVEFEDDVKAS